MMQQINAKLPLTHSLTLIYISSSIVAVLMTAASIGGLLYSTLIYPTEELWRTFVPNDVTNLGVGLPLLLVAMWLARLGRLVGLLCWPGALFFVLYNYVVYVFAMPLNTAFLLHLILVALSAYTAAGLLASIDAETVQLRLTGVVPERLAAGVLIGFGLLFALRVLGVLVTALANQTPLPEAELAVHTADFLTTPAWIIGGVLLWRRRPLGYATGLGLLVQASMLFVALLIFMLLQPILTATPFILTDFAVILLMGMICFIPFVIFVRGVASGGEPSSV